MTTNTANTDADARTGMTESEIDRAFERVATQLKGAPRRAICLPKTGTGDEVIELGFNGAMFLIRRGETVELPEPLCDVLTHAGLL